MEVIEKIGCIILALSILIFNAYYKQWRFEKRFEELYGFKYKKRSGTTKKHPFIKEVPKLIRSNSIK
jgi:hypothetical protein